MFYTPPPQTAGIGIYSARLQANNAGTIAKDVLLNTANITVTITNNGSGLWTITTNLPNSTIISGTVTSATFGGFGFGPPLGGYYTPQTPGNAGGLIVVDSLGTPQNPFEALILTLFFIAP